MLLHTVPAPAWRTCRVVVALMDFVGRTEQGATTPSRTGGRG